MVVWKIEYWDVVVWQFEQCYMRSSEIWNNVTCDRVIIETMWHVVMW